MDSVLCDFLRRHMLVTDPLAVTVEPLSGGVSSDIWRVTAGPREFVVKRALPRLRVAQTWYAPVARNAAEVAWLEEAGRHAPAAVPRVLAHDADAGLFAMPYLGPHTHPVWKAELRAGRACPGFARRLGAILAAIHAGTADRADIAARFDHADTFHAIRLEPYLLATAAAHTDLAPRLTELAERTARRRRCLIHGDVSPKNILAGPEGPMLLDAECATHGDPAFDLAFCLTHLLLKTIWIPAHAADLLSCFDALLRGYSAGVSWEEAGELDARAALLLPALLLARVDGKSPVEYLSTADRARVRDRARRLLIEAPQRAAGVAASWQEQARDDAARC